MSDTMKALEIAENISRCHKTSKALYGEEFPEKMQEYDDIIRACMAKHSLPAMEACMKLIEDVIGQDGSGAFTMNLLAALYEFYTPTK